MCGFPSVPADGTLSLHLYPCQYQFAFIFYVVTSVIVPHPSFARFQASIRNRRVALLCRNLKGKLCEYVHKQSFLHGLCPSFVLYAKYYFSEAGSASFLMCKPVVYPYVELLSNTGIKL